MDEKVEPPKVGVATVDEVVEPQGVDVAKLDKKVEPPKVGVVMLVEPEEFSEAVEVEESPFVVMLMMFGLTICITDLNLVG